MRRSGSMLAVVVAVVALFAPVANAARMTPADKQAISTLIDRFLKDAVERQDLAAGWKLAGPDLQNGTTRSAWIAGTGVTVPTFHLVGNDFRNAWTGHLLSPTHGVLTVVLHPTAASGEEETAATVDVRKLHGRWVVDLFYSAAVFRPAKNKHGSCGQTSCAVSGPNDFGAGASGTPLGNSNSHIRGGWLFVGIGGIGALAVLVPLGLWLRVKRRDRRAWAAYEAQNRAG